MSTDEEELDKLAKDVSDAETKRVAASSAQTQFGRDIHRIITRHRKENHLSYAEVIGVLMLEQAVITDEYIMDHYISDDEEPEEEESWHP